LRPQAARFARWGGVIDFRADGRNRDGVLSAVHGCGRARHGGKIATALGNHGVSISQVIQKERNEGGERVPVVLLTHKTKERCLKAALEEIYSLGSVLGEPPQVIRIERFVS